MADSLVYCVTGDGKGKTTSSLGTIVRALGWGWRVAVIQFIKNDFPTGEMRFFHQHFPEMIFEQHGAGFTNRPGEHELAAREGWARSCELMAHFDGELLVLDEINTAISLGFIPVAEAIAAFRQRRCGLNLYLTGRNADPAVMAFADLVSEIKNVKHPYSQGINAKKGLDF